MIDNKINEALKKEETPTNDKYNGKKSDTIKKIDYKNT
jgi:hypothetical protein